MAVKQENSKEITEDLVFRKKKLTIVKPEYYVDILLDALGSRVLEYFELVGSKEKVPKIMVNIVLKNIRLAMHVNVGMGADKSRPESKIYAGDLYLKVYGCNPSGLYINSWTAKPSFEKYLHKIGFKTVNGADNFEYAGFCDYLKENVSLGDADKIINDLIAFFNAIDSP